MSTGPPGGKPTMMRVVPRTACARARCQRAGASEASAPALASEKKQRLVTMAFLFGLRSSRAAARRPAAKRLRRIDFENRWQISVNRCRPVIKALVPRMKSEDSMTRLREVPMGATQIEFWRGAGPQRRFYITVTRSLVADKREE